MPKKRVIVIGWDCGAPQLAFKNFYDDLPNVKKICNEGIGTKLRSTFPPITIPAWQVMMTGKTPGELGIYGFRYRVNNSYRDFDITLSNKINADRVWDIIGRLDKKSILMGIPPSFPVQPVNGWMIPGFLNPDTDREYTYPKELKTEIENLVGTYTTDVIFRTEKKEQLKKSVFDMTEKQFKVYEHLLKTKDWDFAMIVQIGLDRIQHGFWRYFDPEHHLYEPDSPYKNVIRDYYILLDKWLGKIMQLVDDDTLLIVASDHGAKRMKGCFCVNQWLEKEGYLKFKNKPEEIVRIQKADVNWKKTKAWGWGGYYSRIFFNVKGREKTGKIKPKKLEKEINKLKHKILDVKGPNGEKWNTKVFTPFELFENPQGELPDLMVFWDDLYWRTAGTVGHDSEYLLENDTGPDDGVHDWDGLFMAWNRVNKIDFNTDNLNIKDVFGIVMEHLGSAS